MSVKYMGSKRMMLQNGFGEAIVAQAPHVERIVDLFSGSGAVVWFAAQATERPVYAYDLQQYSAILAGAVICRVRQIDAQRLIAQWLAPTLRTVRRSALWREPDGRKVTAARVRSDRRRCESEAGVGPIWSAYGGHYFSPNQALVLDVALRYLPDREPDRSVCHAAIIAAAAYCAAAPGHTAQPFQPTPTALPYIAESWERDPGKKMEEWVTATAARHAQRRGRAGVADAIEQAAKVTARDLVILDPPYSAVQYSRFYHVLETVAHGTDVSVAGTGRYPPKADRPSSQFSLRTQSEAALTQLLDKLAERGCRALLTFPAGESSNGLSGARVVELAKARFSVSTDTVLGRFSTMGGNNAVRASRHASAELIVSLAPR